MTIRGDGHIKDAQESVAELERDIIRWEADLEAARAAGLSRHPDIAAWIKAGRDMISEHRGLAPHA